MLRKKTTLVTLIVMTLFCQNSYAEKDNIFTRIAKRLSEVQSKSSKPIKNTKIYNTAKQQVGSYYRPGVKAQCANFVGHVVTKAGMKKPANSSMARAWLKWGDPVDWTSKKPGDVIITWRGSKKGPYGHILIYAGENTAIHRSTSGKQVSYIDVDRYKSKVLGVRRAA